MSAARAPRLSHNVYVVELEPAVLKIRRFRARNPTYKAGMPRIYVGMTGLPPELFAHLNPMPYEAAQKMEQELADELQGKGYGVWQA